MRSHTALRIFTSRSFSSCEKDPASGSRLFYTATTTTHATITTRDTRDTRHETRHTSVANEKHACRVQCKDCQVRTSSICFWSAVRELMTQCRSMNSLARSMGTPNDSMVQADDH